MTRKRTRIATATRWGNLAMRVTMRRGLYFSLPYSESEICRFMTACTEGAGGRKSRVEQQEGSELEAVFLCKHRRQNNRGRVAFRNGLDHYGSGVVRRQHVVRTTAVVWAATTPRKDTGSTIWRPARSTEAINRVCWCVAERVQENGTLPVPRLP